MKAMVDSAQRIRFESFELDLRTCELRKEGTPVKLQGQPMQILVMLLERPGEIVTREELQKRLWPNDTFVEFDHSINAAIKRLRHALGDSAENPKYIETLSRRGYRFISLVEVTDETLEQNRAAKPIQVSANATPQSKNHRLLLSGAFVVATLAVLLGLNVGSWREKLRPRAGGSHIDSLAVLPLENLSRDPDQEYFADGITEAVISDLGKIGALRVISRQSVMHFKGSKETLPQIARALNVDAIVEGTVEHSGNRVVVSVDLIQASPEKHLWGEQYSREVKDILVLQNELAQSIAGEIRIRVTPAEKARLTSARPLDPQAYDAYLKARYFWGKFTLDGVNKSIDYYKQAIDKDPGYAPAHAGLAFSYINLVNFVVIPPREGCEKAKAELEYALKEDETLAEAHAWLGYVKMHYDWDLEGAGKEFERGVELNPGDAQIRHVYAHYLLVMGRSAEAWAESKRTLELDPSGIRANSHQGWHYFYVRDYDQAIREFRRALTMEPGDGYSRRYLANAYEQKDMYSEAIAELREIPPGPAWTPTMRAALGYAYAVAGNKLEARNILSELEKDAPKEFVSTLDIALIYLGIGDRNRTLDWLEKAVQERAWFLVYVKIDPRFDSLRSDSRFKKLLRGIRLPR